MTCSHPGARYHWATYLTPSNPPMEITGWWAKCKVCNTYRFNAQLTEQGRCFKFLGIKIPYLWRTRPDRQ